MPDDGRDGPTSMVDAAAEAREHANDAGRRLADESGLTAFIETHFVELIFVAGVVDGFLAGYVLWGVIL